MFETEEIVVSGTIVDRGKGTFGRTIRCGYGYSCLGFASHISVTRWVIVNFLDAHHLICF